MERAKPELCCATLPRPAIGDAPDPVVLVYYLAEQQRFACQRQLLALMAAVLLAGSFERSAAGFAGLVEQRIPDMLRELAELRPSHAPGALTPLRHHMDAASADLAEAVQLIQRWLYRQQAEPLRSLLDRIARLLDHCAALLPGSDMVDRDSACCGARV